MGVFFVCVLLLAILAFLLVLLVGVVGVIFVLGKNLILLSRIIAFGKSVLKWVS